MGKIKYFIGILLCFILIGCVSIPKGFLKPSEGYLEKRQLQMRQYDTTDEKQIITAVAGVLQDLGFNLGESETEIGLVSASKKADATSKGQIAGAVFLDVLGAIGGGGGGGHSNVALCDKYQIVKACVITKPSLDGKQIVVRITIQRVVFNMSEQVGRVETISDPEIYQRFYEGLSKAIFLEAQKI